MAVRWEYRASPAAVSGSSELGPRNEPACMAAMATADHRRRSMTNVCERCLGPRCDHRRDDVPGSDFRVVGLCQSRSHGEQGEGRGSDEHLHDFLAFAWMGDETSGW